MRNMYSGIDTVVKKVDHVVATTDTVIEPVRQSVFKRFPVAIALLVTVGVSAMSHGIERIIDDIAWRNERPAFILVAGIVILVCTGKHNKKLG